MNYILLVSDYKYTSNETINNIHEFIRFNYNLNIDLLWLKELVNKIVYINESKLFAIITDFKYYNNLCFKIFKKSIITFITIVNNSQKLFNKNMESLDTSKEYTSILNNIIHDLEQEIINKDEVIEELRMAYVDIKRNKNI